MLIKWVLYPPARADLQSGCAVGKNFYLLRNARIINSREQGDISKVLDEIRITE